MNKKQTINKIVELENKYQGALIKGYENKSEFINDLMKQENFNDILKYYYSMGKMSIRKETKKLCNEAIELIESNHSIA